MTVQKRADDIRRRVETSDRVRALFDALNDSDMVEAVELHDSHVPPQVEITVPMTKIPTEVSSIIEGYDAVIVPSSVRSKLLHSGSTEALTFSVEVPQLFENAGTRDIRRYGEYSTSVTLTREAVELSGFDVGDEVEVYATEGAILLTE